MKKASPRSSQGLKGINNHAYFQSDKMRLLLLPIFLFSATWLSACATMYTANDPDELVRTFNKAIVAIPRTYYKKYGNEMVYGTFQDVKYDLLHIPKNTKIPLVIFLHGCDGLGSSPGEVSFLARNNYAVIAPNSYARKYKPINCDPYTHRGGLHRGVIFFRLAEAEFAHEIAKTLPWVDKSNIFMMGHSEGGWATAKYTRSLAGRIITGATCNSGWPEYSGISGPRDEPILAIVASKDPWFINNPSTWGD